MKIGKCENLDERQLLQRGNVFQHTLLFLFALLMINGLLCEEGFVLAEGIWNNLLLLWAAFTLCFCEFILREITPLGKTMSVFYCVMGAAGAFILLWGLFSLITGREQFAVGVTLTTCGASTLEGGAMVFIFLVFLGKTCYNRLKREKED